MWRGWRQAAGWPDEGRPRAGRSSAIPCEHRLGRTTGQLGPDTTSAPRADAFDDVIQLQQRILRSLDPAGPPHTVTFGQPTTVTRYFTDLRLIANLICATWPVARRLAISPALADDLHTHIVEQQTLIAEWTQNNTKTPRHTIYDRPPPGRSAAASLIAVADRILTGQPSDLLAELTDGPNGQRWAEHYIRAEQHCSPGLMTAAEPHIDRYCKHPPNGRQRAQPKSDQATYCDPQL